MLTIRLQRAGKKNKSAYRLILAEKTAASQKKFVELLGSYNPHSKALGIKSEERLKYWIDQHAEISPTVHNLLVTKQIISGGKVKAFSLPKKEEAKEEPVAEAPAETAEANDAAAEETAPAEAPTETPQEVPTEESPTPETPVQPEASKEAPTA